jgi:hypothetical protein
MDLGDQLVVRGAFDLAGLRLWIATTDRMPLTTIARAKSMALVSRNE